jgi:predicted ester cyclase
MAIPLLQKGLEVHGIEASPAMIARLQAKAEGKGHPPKHHDYKRRQGAMNIQENKELVRRYIEEVWNGHKLEKVQEFTGDDQLEEAVEHVQQFLAAFPDVHVIIEDLIAEGDKVVARVRASATNKGPFASQPPTGKKVQILSIRIFRIAGHKIVDTWAMQDRLGLMEQLGFLQ